MERIREIRIAKRMTQQTLAESAGISRTGLSFIETGVTQPKIKTIKKLADALEVDWHVLIDD